MRERAMGILRRGLRLFAGIFMVTLLSGALTVANAASKAEAQSIIDKSRGAISDMTSDEAFSWLHSYLKSAKGVLIFPQVLKAGFFLGGSGGTGVLLIQPEAKHRDTETHRRRV